MWVEGMASASTMLSSSHPVASPTKATNGAKSSPAMSAKSDYAVMGLRHKEGKAFINDSNELDVDDSNSEGEAAPQNTNKLTQRRSVNKAAFEQWYVEIRSP